MLCLHNTFSSCNHWSGFETDYGMATGWLYAIGAGSPLQFVKIGYTSQDPAKRLRSLQTASPFPLMLLAYWPGSYDMEGELHDVLKHDRAHGEWFFVTDYVVQTISHMTKWGILR